MKQLLVAILLFLAFPVFAQVDSDSIFDSAIKNARAGDYDKAIEEAEYVLKLHPDRYDVMVFTANVYAWMEDYEKALMQIESAYALNKTYKELYDSWLNILLWSKNYKRLIETTELALQNNYSDNYNIFLKNLLAYRALGEYKKGLKLVEDEKSYLDSATIKEIYNEMQMLNNTNAISFYYSIDFFEKNTIAPQHLMYIDYAFKISDNTLIPRLNYANRFDRADYQLELDYYHLFSNRNYVYANYGVSFNNTLFPQHRAGLEYYTPFFNTFEASLGGRFLYSENGGTMIATGHVGKYVGNFWFSIRPFYVFHDTKNALTTVFNSRYYSDNPVNYWGLELVYGNSPDDRYVFSQSPDNLLLNNYRIKVSKNIAFFIRGELRISASYAYEEYVQDFYRNRFAIETILKYKF